MRLIWGTAGVRCNTGAVSKRAECPRVAASRSAIPAHWVSEEMADHARLRRFAASAGQPSRLKVGSPVSATVWLRPGGLACPAEALSQHGLPAYALRATAGQPSPEMRAKAGVPNGYGVLFSARTAAVAPEGGLTVAAGLGGPFKALLRY